MPSESQRSPVAPATVSTNATRTTAEEKGSAARGRPSTRVDTRELEPACLAVAAAIVSGLPIPTVVLDEGGVVACSNASARSILGNCALFVDHKGRLRSKIPPLAEAFATARKSRPGESRLLRVVDFGPHGDIVLRISRVATTMEPAAPLLTIVCFTSETAAAIGSLAALCEVYGLTADEASAALALYSGQRVRDFAACFGIDILAAHDLCERARERLGVAREVDVARRVAVLGHMALPSGAAGPRVRGEGAPR